MTEIAFQSWLYIPIQRVNLACEERAMWQRSFLDLSPEALILWWDYLLVIRRLC